MYFLLGWGVFLLTKLDGIFLDVINVNIWMLVSLRFNFLDVIDYIVVLIRWKLYLCLLDGRYIHAGIIF